MHPNEIDLRALDKKGRKALRREAERLGVAHVRALEVQWRRQAAQHEVKAA